MAKAEKLVRIGFIGYGVFSRVRQRYLEQLKDVRLVGFYDLYQDDCFEIPRFKCLEELLKVCDAVLVSVPPKFAPEYVCKALAANKKVFCEKPAARSLQELEKIKPYLQGSFKLLAYGFNHRQHPSIQKMKAMINNGDLGKILWIRGRYGKEVDDNYINTWRSDLDLNGGGIIIDQGLHMIDLVSDLAGGFDRVQALLSDHYLGVKGLEDNGFITLYSSRSKISASIHSTISQWRYLFSLEIFLEKGSIILNGLRTNSGNYGDEVLTIKPNRIHESEMGIIEIKYTDNVSWKREMAAFVESAQNSTDYKYAGYDDALKTTALVDLIYKEAVWL